MDLRFVCEMLKEVNPHSPSITQIKSIKLPTFTPPKKVSACMLNGNKVLHLSYIQQFYSDKKKSPFYVNLPTTILENCLKNEDIATKLVRYPVHTDGQIR